MDIPEISIASAQATVIQQVNIAMLANNLKSMETIGEDFAKMLELSVNPDVGSNFDVSV